MYSIIKFQYFLFRQILNKHQRAVTHSTPLPSLCDVLTYIHHDTLHFPTPSSHQLQVFRPFFVSLNLPYAVKRGEVVGIQCVVFNYHDRDLIADVTLEHQGDLEFTSFSDEAANEVEGEKKGGNLGLNEEE